MQLLVNYVHFFTLQTSLVSDVLRDVSNVSHDCGDHVNCLTSILDHIGHLMGLSLLTDATKD